MKGIISTVVLFCLEIVVLFCLEMLAYLYYGFVLQTAWSWLIVPNSTMPEISHSLAVGIVLVAGIIKQPRLTRPEVNEDGSFREKVLRYILFFGNCFMIPTMFLLSAFCLKFII